MRYLFLVVALLVVGCGKSPVAPVVEDHYYFTGQTLLKVGFEDRQPDSVAFDPTFGTITALYYFPLPADFGFDYTVILPMTVFYASDSIGKRGNWSLPVVFVNDSVADGNAISAGVFMNHYKKIIIFRATSMYHTPVTNDSATVFQNTKVVIDNSWFTYQIQRAIDIDSL